MAFHQLAHRATLPSTPASPRMLLCALRKMMLAVLYDTSHLLHQTVTGSVNIQLLHLKTCQSAHLAAKDAKDHGVAGIC
jgi:hypothetical protein